ncbi:MAG TPA: M15 family metallopeptidase [Gemmatimonadaceae bacterium]|jgi:peptidoglycan L-alanyl-D-glutamate endopeptidase CwlK|nr:M15 family metallopeptidase [Gemmatimonadaceae bacterium]
MSAGANTAMVNRDLGLLAPKFRDAVQRALQGCADRGRDAFVYEAYRSTDLQGLYYARGRTVTPPTDTVTNARSNLYSWHGFGLAVDVISRTHGWDWDDMASDVREAERAAWQADVAECFRAAGCRWGGEWKMKDLPHFQWGLCKPSPSDRARELMASGGLQAVWTAVAAI